MKKFQAKIPKNKCSPEYNLTSQSKLKSNSEYGLSLAFHTSPVQPHSTQPKTHFTLLIIFLYVKIVHPQNSSLTTQ